LKYQFWIEIFVYIYIELKFGRGQSGSIFTKIETKLRQKLKYKDQMENWRMRKWHLT